MQPRTTSLFLTGASGGAGALTVIGGANSLVPYVNGYVTGLLFGYAGSAVAGLNLVCLSTNAPANIMNLQFVPTVGAANVYFPQNYDAFGSYGIRIDANMTAISAMNTTNAGVIWYINLNITLP